MKEKSDKMKKTERMKKNLKSKKKKLFIVLLMRKIIS